jgi:Mediator of CRAC channel activity
MSIEGLAEMVQAAVALQNTIREPRWRMEDRDWRAEDRAWRQEDRVWRKDDVTWRLQDLAFIEHQKLWRAADLHQRTLDNARALWARFVEKNRRDVEERAEQLKSIGNIAALVSGFAVVAFFEFQADWKAVSQALEVIFGFTTALVVRERPIFAHAIIRQPQLWAQAVCAASLPAHPLRCAVTLRTLTCAFIPWLLASCARRLA